jgi:hypothetical protein
MLPYFTSFWESFYAVLLGHFLTYLAWMTKFNVVAPALACRVKQLFVGTSCFITYMTRRELINDDASCGNTLLHKSFALLI